MKIQGIVHGFLQLTFLFLAFGATGAGTETIAREIETNGCRAVWTEKTLEIGNRHFTRRYVARDGILRTTLFKAKDGTAWYGRVKAKDAADAISVTAEAAKWSPVGVEGLRLAVTVRGATTRLDLYPDMSGVIVLRPGMSDCPALHDATRPWFLNRDGTANPLFRKVRDAMRAADAVSTSNRHVTATSFTCLDQTDTRDRLLVTDARQMMRYEAVYTLASSGLDLQDVISKDGLVFVRVAPMPSSRPAPVEDFIVNGWEECAALLANGYPLVELAYAGGAAGRRRALVAFQRSIRPYRPGRDGLLLSNTWGGGHGDARVCQDFLLKEIEAGAKMGVDVIQIDDGWQHGRTANSRKKANEGKMKVWTGYWATDPDFWKEDRERFPDGLDLLVKKAREKGMRFGLWFGPDTSDEAANWERDADCLLDYHRRLGIDYFKMDSMKLFTDRAFARNRKMFDKMLTDSDGDMVFDLDSTAEIRPGFFGLIDIGPQFVENRYTGRGVYWPHHTLKNLWDLAHVIDPVRLRFEFNNPDTNRDRYGWSPLGHGEYRPDALFATVMAASPLAWMEVSEVSGSALASIGALVRTWKAERARWHGGVIHPVGEQPDGVSWTGFVSEAADGNGGYALLFREMNGRSSHTLDLEPIFGSVKVSDATVIGGRGTARIDGTKLTVWIKNRLDFIWVRFNTRSDVPALLTTADGAAVTSVAAWEKTRRPEILRTMTEEVYGVRPVERPSDLAFKVLKEEPAFGGKAVKKLVRGTYSGPGGAGELTFAVWRPTARAKAPAFVHLAPRPAETAADPDGPRPVYLLPAEMIVDRGYAAIAVCEYDTSPDWDRMKGDKPVTNGVFKVFGPSNLNTRNDCEWGILSAWAWGASRVMDWIETEPTLDARRVGVVGLSRNGKTALVAGATDPRFALTVSCCSGMCGAKLNHMFCGGSEDVEAILLPALWFTQRFRQWRCRDREMPFDQHWLLALIAPRLLFVSSATEDCWAGPTGEFASCRHASPAWELYGRKGLVEQGYPAPDEPLLEGSVGYCVRTGRHAIQPADWRTYLDFADAKGWAK